MSSDTPREPQQASWQNPDNLTERRNDPSTSDQASPDDAPTSQAIPVPIEMDDDGDDDIVRPIPSPSAEETFPAGGRGVFGGLPTTPVSPYDAVNTPGSGTTVPEEPLTRENPDPIHRLGLSATTQASLSASGAKTPMGGVPLPMSRRERRALTEGEGEEHADASSEEEAYPFAEPSEPFLPRFQFADQLERSELPVVTFSHVNDPPPEPQTEPDSEPGSDSKPDEEPVPADPILARNPYFAPVSEEPAVVSEEPTPTHGEPIPADDEPTTVAATPVDTAQDEPEPESSYEPAEDAYTPTTAAPEPPPAAPFPHAGGEEPPMDTTVDESTPWWRSVVALVIYGLIVMAAVGFALSQMFFTSEEIAIPQEVLIEGPEEGTITPVDLEDPTEFLASAPRTSLEFALIEARTHDLGDVDLFERTAEVHDLTYSNGTDTFYIRAYQHYNEADALGTWEALSEGSTDIAPVEANDEAVGERAIIEAEDGTAVAWRNLTGVFWLTGPDDAVVEFFDNYGW